jgi:hypothetical protein
MCIPLVGKGKTTRTAAEESERRRYAEQAMEALHDAVRKGYKDWKNMSKDPDLEPLRGRADFQKLLRSISPAPSRSLSEVTWVDCPWGRCNSDCQAPFTSRGIVGQPVIAQIRMDVRYRYARVRVGLFERGERQVPTGWT